MNKLYAYTVTVAPFQLKFDIVDYTLQFSIRSKTCSCNNRNKI